MMRPLDVIPKTRTVVALLTDRRGGRAHRQHRRHRHQGSLNQSLDTLSATIDQIAPELSPTFDGLTRVSRALNDRDDTLGELLENGADVTKILAERSQQVNTLILDANDLMAVLLGTTLGDHGIAGTYIGDCRSSWPGVIHDNEQRTSADVGQAQRGDGDIGEESRQHSQSAARVGEVSDDTGRDDGQRPLLPGVHPESRHRRRLLQPWLDYAFGFRRGTNAGQPPDNAGPRAELPFPYNGIPGPGEQWGPPR